MKNEPWRPKPGELVQIWDYQNETSDPNAKIAGHGMVGYVIKKASTGTGENFSADIWKIICFGDNEGIYHKSR